MHSYLPNSFMASMVWIWRKPSRLRLSHVFIWNFYFIIVLTSRIWYIWSLSWSKELGRNTVWFFFFQITKHLPKQANCPYGEQFALFHYCKMLSYYIQILLSVWVSLWMPLLYWTFYLLMSYYFNHCNYRFKCMKELGLRYFFTCFSIFIFLHEFSCSLKKTFVFLLRLHGIHKIA